MNAHAFGPHGFLSVIAVALAIGCGKQVDPPPADDPTPIEAVAPAPPPSPPTPLAVPELAAPEKKLTPERPPVAPPAFETGPAGGA